MTARISPQRLRILFTLFERLHHREWIRIVSGISGSMCFIAMIGILSHIPIRFQESPGQELVFDVGQIALGIILLVYLFYDWKLAIGFTLVLYGFYRFAAEVPSGLYYWILGIGATVLIVDISFLEKRKFKLFSFGWAGVVISLVGPLWVYARSLGYDKREF